MDLSVSPDWDTRLCYLVVLLCGLVSARIQLYKRFVEAKISGAWLVPNTWLVFGIYVFIPIALFWLMDRTSALTDTSLFAALLIGLAYPAILAGGFGGMRCDCIHQRRRQAVIRLELEFFKSRADRTHVFRFCAGLDDGRDEGGELRRRPA